MIFLFLRKSIHQKLLKKQEENERASSLPSSSRRHFIQQHNSSQLAKVLISLGLVDINQQLSSSFRNAMSHQQIKKVSNFNQLLVTMEMDVIISSGIH